MSIEAAIISYLLSDNLMNSSRSPGPTPRSSLMDLGMVTWFFPEIIALVISDNLQSHVPQKTKALPYYHAHNFYTHKS